MASATLLLADYADSALRLILQLSVQESLDQLLCSSVQHLDEVVLAGRRWLFAETSLLLLCEYHSGKEGFRRWFWLAGKHLLRIDRHARLRSLVVRWS